MQQVETSYNSSLVFVHSMHFEYLMFHNRWNRESNVIVIPFAMGTYQGDPWEKHYLFWPILGLYIL
jgi:hypothetical protein